MIATIPVKDEQSAARVDRMKRAMRADQVAGPAVALSAPDAKDVSGQIFAVRGNEIFLMSQPRPVRGLARLEGWTVDSILEHAVPAMKPSLDGNRSRPVTTATECCGYHMSDCGVLSKYSARRRFVPGEVSSGILRRLKNPNSAISIFLLGVMDHWSAA